MGPLVLARSAEEHGGPAQRVVLGSDAAGRRRALRHGLPLHRGRLAPAHAAGRAAALPRAADGVGRRRPAQVGPAALARRAARAPRRRLRARRPPKTSPPAWSRTAIPRPAQRTKAQFTVSWMYDKQGLRLLVDGIGPGTRSRRTACARRSRSSSATPRRRRSPTPSSRSRRRPRRTGLLAIQPNEPDLYGYTDENVDALAAFRAGRTALLDFDYGLEIVRLTMAAYLSAERGAVVDLTDPATMRRSSTTTCPRSSRAAAHAQLLVERCHGGEHHVDVEQVEPHVRCDPAQPARASQRDELPARRRSARRARHRRGGSPTAGSRCSPARARGSAPGST